MQEITPIDPVEPIPIDVKPVERADIVPEKMPLEEQLAFKEEALRTLYLKLTGKDWPAYPRTVGFEEPWRHVARCLDVVDGLLAFYGEKWPEPVVRFTPDDADAASRAAIEAATVEEFA